MVIDVSLTPKGRCVPTRGRGVRFEEALDLVAGLDLSATATVTDPATAAVVAAPLLGRLENRPLVTSFSAEALAVSRHIAPRVRTGLRVRSRAVREPAAAIRTATDIGAALVLPHALNSELILAPARAAGLGVLPWAVNDLRSIGRGLEGATDAGAITDLVTAALANRDRVALGDDQVLTTPVGPSAADKIATSINGLDDATRRALHGNRLLNHATRHVQLRRGVHAVAFDRAGAVIGWAGAVALEESGAVEFAVVVADPWRAKGSGARWPIRCSTQSQVLGHGCCGADGAGTTPTTRTWTSTRPPWSRPARDSGGPLSPNRYGRDSV